VTFHSFQFALFMALVVPLYWLLANRRDARYALLLVASYVFYGLYEFWYLSLIVFSTLLDYHCGRRIHAAPSERGRRAWLCCSLIGNVGVLAFFKYTDWALDSLKLGLAALGVHVDLHAIKLQLLPAALMDPRTLDGDGVARILVPVGISFYTFQTLSYTIDVYRGKLAPARNLRDFALFVAFFPQLVAGPIVRAVHFIPQLDLRPRFDRGRLHDGLFRMGVGLSKKVMLADVIGGQLVDPVYAAPDEYTPLVHALCLYGFAFQIYFDFSGYSDIAIGAARMLGFDLPENFDLPYRSRSVREFWRRWHISLSFWVRDYIYFPLGGSRGAEWRVQRNLFITMLTIGLWHGASLLWVAYGTLQAVALIGERIVERMRGGRPFATSAARGFSTGVLTFHFIVLTCLFIRARSMEHIEIFLTRSGPNGWDTVGWTGLVALGFGALTHWMPPRLGTGFKERLVAMPTPVAGAVFGLVIGLVAVLVVGETPYIYFAF